MKWIKCFILLLGFLQSFSYAQNLPKYGTENTIEICNWNIEWFGKKGFGPSNKTLQKENVGKFISETNIDIIAFQEVANRLFFDTMMQGIPNYRYVIANYGAEQKTAVVFNDSQFKLHKSGLLANGVIDSFSTGRYPLLVELISKTNIKDTLLLIVLHLKSNFGSDAEKAEAYNSRKKSLTWLKNYCNAFLQNKNFILLGDFNDDLDQSIYKGLPSPLASLLYQNNPKYYFLTERLTQNKIPTTVSYPTAIDHQMVSEGLKNRLFSGADTINLKGYFSNYATNTSDHYPVISKFKNLRLSLYPLSTNTIEIYPNPAQNYFEIKNWAANMSIEIFSVDGKLVKGFDVKNNLVLTDKIPNGIYFLRIKDSNKVLNYKFIINK